MIRDNGFYWVKLQHSSLDGRKIEQSWIIAEWKDVTWIFGKYSVDYFVLDSSLLEIDEKQIKR